MRTLNIFIIIAIVSLTGCASVKFLENNEEKGFLYYPPKPYLHIYKEGSILKSSIISFPDTSRPLNVKYAGFIGSADLGFEIENGMIKSFNSKQDSKASEFLTSIGSLGTASAAIKTARAAFLEASNPPETTQLKELGNVSREISSMSDVKIPSREGMKLSSLNQNNYSELFEQMVSNANQKYDIDIISKARATLDDIKQSLLHANAKGFYKVEIETIDIQIDVLSNLTTISYPLGDAKQLISKLDEYKKKVASVNNELRGVYSILEIHKAHPTEFKKYFNVSTNVNKKLKKTIGDLSKFSSSKNSLEGLYEINFINSRLTLRKVSF